MIAYIILFVCLLFLVYIDKGSNRKKVFVISGTLVFLILALRNENVGTDTITYVNCWNSPNYYYNGLPTDIGFEMILRFLHSFDNSNEYFIVCTSAIMMYGVLYFINKSSNFRADSLLFFSTAGTVFVFFLLYLAAMRQCIAMAFVLIGLCNYFDNYNSRKKKIISSLFIIAAATIHGSSAIVIPALILLPYIKINKQVVIASVIITYLFGAFGIIQISSLLSFINLSDTSFEKYSGYTSEMTFGLIEGRGGINMFSLPFSLIMIYITIFTAIEKLNNWTFKWLWIGVILTNLMVDNLMWGRLLVYFTIVSIVVFPNMLRTVNVKYKYFVYAIVILFFLRKVLTVLAGAELLGKLNNINTEVPYESWLSW